MDKKAQRKRILKQRNQLTPKQTAEAAKCCAQQIAQSAIFKKSQHIAFYHAVKNEPDPAIAALTANALQKICYLPRLNLENHQLDFFPFDPETPMQENQYGIPEPIPDKNQTPFPPEKLDLVLVPLVATDEKGNRLGMGKGCYDRTFSFLKDNRTTTPHLMGLAYKFQIIDPITPDDWDIPLNSILII